MSNEFKPTEKMEELRQPLMTLPVAQRKQAPAGLFSFDKLPA